VWFAGDHSDVGGGHKGGNSPLTDASLRWMLGEATHQAWLRLKPGAGDAIKAIIGGSACASRTAARSLWIRRGFILLDLVPREELDNVVYPPLRPWRVLWLNGARKPGDHSLHDTVYVHHTVDARMRVGDARYSSKRLTRRSDSERTVRVIQIQAEQDLPVVNDLPGADCCTEDSSAQARSPVVGDPSRGGQAI
jgi:type VI secretion system (T6SS) phospholipase Tle1-like effector